MREDDKNRNAYQGRDESYGQHDRSEETKNYGKSYRNDDYNRSSQNSDRGYDQSHGNNSDRSYGQSYNQNYNQHSNQGSQGQGQNFNKGPGQNYDQGFGSSDRGSLDMMNNFSGANSRDMHAQSDWNMRGRESGFGQSNQRDQSYGQQYGRPYTAGDMYPRQGADQGSYGQDTGANSRYQSGYQSDAQRGYQGSQGGGYHPSEFQGWDNQGQNYRGNDAQQSIYGSAGFGSLGTGMNNSQNQNSNGRQTPASYMSGTQTGTHYGKGPKSFKRSDERIKEELSEMFTRHHEVDASDIEIDVKEGEVTLSGYVPERRMKYMAEDLAEKSMGVKDVTNNIRVKKEDSSFMDTMTSESDRGDRKTGGQPGKTSSSNTVINPKH